MHRRSSGILMHVSALPSDHGIGDLGPEALRFVDFLAAARQSLWQVLPLYPTEPAHGNSPYSSVSSFAGSPILISPDTLVQQGLLAPEEVSVLPPLPAARVDYPAAEARKRGLLEAAFRRFQTLPRDPGFDRFCETHAAWLEPFVIFMALKRRFAGRVWSEWPIELRDRHPGALARARAELQEDLSRGRFVQYLFSQQWEALRAHCRRHGIQVIGDLPIYVNYDSAEVWSQPEIFQLGEDRRPRVVSGVPPDYFSATGQRWGNPLYDWQVLQRRGFDWWIQRMQRAFELYDWIRIDHFRGLVAYWEVPAHESTAVNGRWVDVPVEAFFDTLLKHFVTLPIVAEDLGLITPDVREVVQRYDVPGMKVLLFGFNEDQPAHPYLPHMYPRRCVVYTGTHDNNTARGWYEREARPEDRRRLASYLGREVSSESVPWELIRMAMASVADTSIAPLQDVLGLGDEARMNRPAQGEGNWEWRLQPGALAPGVTERLAQMTLTYGRG
ncbi:MAG: 4-alpha-glucanotransferase [Candidatus Eisenbacteria bacterium]